MPVNGDGTPKHIGDDYIGCITREGAFVSFQFDDVSESFDKVSDGNFYRAVCVALGGSPDGVMPDAVRKAGMAAEAGVGAVGAVALASPAVATLGAAGAAVIDQAAAASVSGCAGITRKQCEMIDPMAGYNENTKLCQFVR